jgi:sodium/proline symporter
MSIEGIMIIIYFLITAVVGIYASQKMKSAEDFWVAGRTLGVPKTVATFVAAFISPTSLLGLIGIHYSSGWGSMWMYGGTIGSMMVYTLWLAKKYNQVGASTIPDILHWRFDKRARGIAAVIICIGAVLYAAATAIGGSYVLEIGLGLNLTVGMIIMCVVFVIWCTLGGYTANATVDIVHTIVKLAAFILIFVGVLAFGGGFTAVNQAAYEVDPKLFTGIAPLAIVAYFITWGFGNMGQPAYVARCFSAKNARTAAASFGMSAVVLAICYFMCVTIGVGGRAFYPTIESADKLTLHLSADFYPPIVSGLIFSAIIGAGISVASSIILAGSTSFANDIYKTFLNKNASDSQLIKVSRISTLVMGILVIPFAVCWQEGIGAMTIYIFGIYASALTAPILLGFLWKRYNTYGAMVTMILATVIAIVWQLLGQPSLGLPGVKTLHPAIPAFIIGILSGVIVSLCTSKPTDDIIDRFFPKKNNIRVEVEG